MSPAVKRVTRAVRPEDLRELLEHPPRATLAFVRDGRVDVTPVAFRWDSGRYLVGFAAGTASPAGTVKLVVDDGPWYFDLRGVWVRGTLAACNAPAGAAKDLSWSELAPQKTAAWHYGTMREN